MSDGVVFLNQHLLWPVVLIGLLLFVVFVWKEWSQRKERRFWVKFVAAFSAIVSLVMIVLKPSTHQEATRGKAIILTEGYRPAQLDSLTAIYKRIPMEEYTKGRTLSILEDADSLFLLGHGLVPFDLWQIQDKSVAFLGGKKVGGWTAISSNRNEAILGESLEINAKYSNPKIGHLAVLTDNGGNPLDSVPFEELGEQVVTFRTTPKVSGEFVYHLLVKNEDGVLSDEPLPLKVVAGEPLKVLLINTFPTFETKYLKNFLTERGHEVLARTQLTKGKYKFEYFNGASNPIYGFTSENLKDYDLLIIDTDSYTGLGRASKAAMEEIVESNGLGVFIQPNESLFRLGDSNSPFKFNRDFLTEITFGELEQTLQKYPFTFQEEVRTQEVLVDSAAVAAYVPVQMGKVGTTLLQNTYQLVLDGNEPLYAHIWTQILNSMAKEQQNVAEWSSITKYPRPDQPFEFELYTALNDLTVKTDEGEAISLLQDDLMTHKWTGTQYPRKTGWNQLQVSHDSIAPFSYFVYGRDQLQSITKSETLKANYRAFGKTSSFAASVSATKKELVPISPLWFYIVLLLCMGWLWLEPKLVD
ncbi:MAG: hypothetical protein VX798_03635 [Bacteroidota bacterium]|uniref:Aerotolerance regulator N-terminal domain-containing protein n=1 Tax=Flagellimonas profundi TaxID=2915620 RepID=A0ABS3FBC3_9FLAO|nr:hypothetical protein [Allomuricauda profundi]MBO0340458.1 hypothetical protein [Allomuricauda profundi]MEC7770246.1 hypothetical protein [Bacteroidota bacterium]